MIWPNIMTSISMVEPEMPKRVFWDTAAFVALANSADVWHMAAVAVSREMANDRATIVTTDAVLTEVINTFSRIAWRPVAVRIVTALQRSVALGAAKLVPVDESLWLRGWQLFGQRTDKDWSLTDCISLVVMRELGLTQAFTSDHHFEQAGFTILLKKP